MKTQPKYDYEYDLPMTDRDLDKHTPELDAKLREVERVNRLYRIAADIEHYSKWFVVLASQGEGPMVSRPGFPVLMAYCVQAMSMDCIEDLISLGVSLRDPLVVQGMQGAPHDAIEFYEGLLERYHD